MSDDWYKRDTGAWLMVEQHLDLDEIGALNLLADMTHRRSSWFVDDDKRVALSASVRGSGDRLERG